MIRIFIRWYQVKLWDNICQGLHFRQRHPLAAIKCDSTLGHFVLGFNWCWKTYSSFPILKTYMVTFFDRKLNLSILSIWVRYFLIFPLKFLINPVYQFCSVYLDVLVYPYFVYWVPIFYHLPRFTF
jgi:hypothetical protein